MNNVNPEQDAGLSTATKPADLAAISRLGIEVLTLKSQIEAREKEIELKKARILQIQRETLPNMMSSIGMTEFSLNTGHIVAVSDIVQGSIPSASAIEECEDPVEKSALEDRREQAFKWLRSNKAGALIKNKLTVNFQRGQEKDARKFKTLIQKAGFDAELVESVHPQTLTAFFREQLAAGRNIPSEPFKLFTGKQATITVPKPKKGAK
jgi:hypothetical protein